MSRFAKVFGILVLLLIVLPSILAGVPPLLAAYFRLLFGWLIFLPDRLPKATIRWGGIGMMAACLVLTVAFAHHFCGWLWRGTGRAEAWRPRWTLTGITVVLLMLISGMAITGLAHQVGWLMTSPEPWVKRSGSNERGIPTSLKTIASAQSDFRANDRDDNRTNDFWRADIAGLYTTEVEGHAIRLIELSVALADDRPKGNVEKYGARGPKAGYWYRALLHEDETVPDPQRFAACSFPAQRSAGRWMYVVCEDNGIWRKEFRGKPPEFYPKDPAADGWTKLD